MATMIKLAGNGIGGVVQGNFGVYQAASDGTFLVDSRDVSAMLVLGLSYISNSSRFYTTTAAAAASSGRIVSSAALSNGAASIANQPDIPRQVVAVIGTGTTAISAGTVSVTYTGNDGQSTVDVLSAITPASTNRTLTLSKGVGQVASVSIAGLVGGTSPFIHMDTTTMLTLPVDPGAVDVAVYKENVDGANETVGTLSTTVLGGITPTTAPNGTHTYSFGYTFTAPTA